MARIEHVWPELSAIGLQPVACKLVLSLYVRLPPTTLARVSLSFRGALPPSIPLLLGRSLPHRCNVVCLTPLPADR